MALPGPGMPGKGPGSHINDLHFRVVRQYGDVADQTVSAVAGREAGQIDDILGDAERWGIGKFQMTEIFNRHAADNRRRQDVQTFIDTLEAAGLCAKEPAVSGSQRIFTVNGLAPG